MFSPKNFHTTTAEETALPVTYIEKYQDENTRSLFEKYKFNTERNIEYLSAKNSLEHLIYDIILHIQSNPLNHPKTSFYFTAPPSTMHARGEKIEDSMRELLRQDIDLYTKIFSVKLSHIKYSKAQHIGSSRKKRLANMSGRYSISWSFRFKLFVNKHQNISITILDDVCSTGGTLLSCKQTLERYLEKIQKKKPDVRWTIQVFSIAH